VSGQDAGRQEEIVVIVASRARVEVLREFGLETLPAWLVVCEGWFVKSPDASQRGKISRAAVCGTKFTRHSG
jgi:hypothetical protein